MNKSLLTTDQMRHLRDEKKLTYREIAEIAGITKQAVRLRLSPEIQRRYGQSPEGKAAQRHRYHIAQNRLFAECSLCEELNNGVENENND